MSGQSVYKVGIVISADASGVKPGVASTKTELASIGAAAAGAQTKMQQLIATATGLHTGAANGNTNAWTGILAGIDPDQIRAKYNPVFAVIQQYKAAQVEIRTAHAMGALSSDEMTAALQRQRQAALASIDAIKGISAANAAVASHTAEVERLRASLIPLYAAQQNYKAALEQIGQAEKLGAVSASEAATLRLREKDSFDALTASMNTAQTKMQQLIATATGLHVGGGDNSKAWTGALAAEGLAADNVRAKYDPLYATITRYKSALTELKTAHAMGEISADQMTAAISRQRQAALASIDVIKGRNVALQQGSSMGGHNFAATNAMFQLQDIGMTAAMGMSPAMIALQQGSQLAGNFAGMGFKQVGATMAGAFTQLLSPVSLATVAITGLTAAAIQYFMKSDQETEKANKSLEEHGNLIRRLREAYGEAAMGARDYAGESKKILGQDTADSLKSYRKLLDESAKTLLAGGDFSFLDLLMGSGPLSRGDYGGNTYIIGQMQSAISQLKDSAAAGTPDIQSFVEKLIEIENHPAVPKKVQEMAQELRKLAAEGLAAQKAMSDLLNMPGLQRGVLIGGTSEQDRLRYLDDQRLSLDKMRAEAAARQSALFARSPLEKADAARQQASLDTSGSADQFNARVEIAGTEALAQAEKQLADAKRDRVRSITETVDSQQLELSLIGKTISETEALRMQYQLTSALKAEAAKNGVAVDQDELRLIEEKSRAYGRVAEQMAAINVIRGQQDAIEQQRAELALVGQSDEVRRRSLALLEAEQTIRSQGLTTNSAAADLIRKGALAAADQTAEVERLRDAWGEVQSAIEGVVNNGVDKLIEGDWSGALDAVKKEIVGGLTQIGIKNPLANALDGGNRGTISDVGGLGGIVGRLFGGEAKTPQSIVSGAMQSVASMSVNAASVVINGGVGGDVSRLFSPANNNNAGGLLGGTGGAGSALSFVGNYKGAGVDPRLTDILNLAAQQTTGFKVDAISGYRAGDPRFHGKGMATDVQLTDLASGKLLGNYQDASSFSAYEKFAQNARQIQMAKYPELADQFRWGGYFGGGKGKYGALDTMHFDLAGKGMAGGSWDGGLNSAQKSLWPGIESQGNAATKALQNLAGQGNVAAQGLGSLGTGLDKFGSTLSSAGAGGSSSGGGLFGWFKGLFGGSSQFAAASAGTLKPGLFSDGGWTGPGGVYQPAGIVHAGEVVFSQADVARHGGVGNVEAMRLGRRFGSYASGGAVSVASLPPASFAPSAPGAGSSTVSIAVNNYSGQEVQTQETTDSRGNRQVTMTIGQQASAAIRQRGNPARKAIQDEYRLKPGGVAR